MPSRDAVKRALALMRGDAEYYYFFTQLTSPGWVRPLLEEGRFSHPPTVIREGTSISFPSWPESEYLARVASQAPDEAASVLLQIPPTENHRVHLDLVEVALRVPLAAAAEWSRQEAQWLSSQEWLLPLLPEKEAELINRLAEDGYASESLGLFSALFALRPAGELRADEGKEIRLPPTPQAKMDTWDYQRCLRLAMPTLAKHLGSAALDAASDLLECAIRLSSTDREPEPPVDYSFIWRDAIEHSDEHGDLRDTLIDAVRDSAEVLGNAGQCGEVAQQLFGRRWDTFRRIAVHVLRVACADGVAMRASEVLSRESFEDIAIHHEYVLLLRDVFPKLRPNQQANILRWIDVGPNRDEMRERHARVAGERPTDDQLDSWVQQWQRDRLAPLVGHLPSTWQARFDGYVRQHGEPEFVYSLHHTHTAWVTERSPLSEKEISALGSEELRQFLKEWTPSTGFSEPSRAGVVRALGALDNAFYERESANAAQWCDLDPAYIAALVGGFQRTANTGVQLMWGAILELCQCVADAQSLELDAGLAKESVAQLVIATLDREPSPVPRSFAATLESVVEALVNAGFKDESTRILSAVDDLTAAINSVSGKALEAAIRFAVWSKRSTDDKMANWALADRLPSLSGLLGRAIDPRESYPTRARAILGAQLGPMFWLDTDWVKAHADALLPQETELAEQRQVVWDTYIAYGQPLVPVLSLFRGEYQRAITELPGPVEGEARRNVVHRLTEHLLTYCWQGLLTLSDEDGLLRQFYSRASSELRSYATQFVGRSLKQSGEVPSDPLRRLQELIDWRIGTLKSSESVSAKDIDNELKPFGWWFASGKFEPEWSLSRLEALLRLGVHVEPDHMVIEQLLQLVVSYPVEVAETLRLMITTSGDKFRVAGWSGEVRQLLSALGRSRDPVVRAKVAASVDALLGSGYLAYRDLMPSPQVPG